MTDWTGPEIKRRRLHHKLSQQQVADAVGVSVAAVSRWERGDRARITNANRERLEAALPPPPGEYEVLPEAPWAGAGSRFATNVEWTPEEIVRRRLTLGMTQGQLATAAGASRRTVVGWEAEGNPPSARYLRRLQRVLRLPEDDPGYDPGIALSEASREEILEHLGEGPLLRDAEFSAVLLRMVELHNLERERQGLPPLLQIGDVTMPGDLPEHDRGRSVERNAADQVNFDATTQNDTHPR